MGIRRIRRALSTATTERRRGRPLARAWERGKETHASARVRLQAVKFRLDDHNLNTLLFFISQIILYIHLTTTRLDV